MCTTRWASRIGSLFVFLVLAACGGGGGGGSSGGVGGGDSVVPPTQPPVIAHAVDYWQASNGSLWLFEGRDATTNTTYRNRTTLGAPMTLDGTALTRFDYTNALNDGESPQYRSFGSEGIRTYLELAPTSPTYSYLELPAEIRLGTYRAFDSGAQPVQGGTMRITVDVAVNGLEALSVAGGDFANALHTTHIVAATLATSAGSSTGQSTIDYWYAKGIGIVKQVLTDPNYAAGSNTYSEELAGVITAGVKAGVVGEFDLLQNLNGGSSTTTTGRAGVASDGSGFLVVAYKTVNYTPSLVATYVQPDGTVRFADQVIAQLGIGGPMSPDTSYGPVHVAWDGAHFWVVAEGAFYGMVGGVVRQRVNADGSVLDGPNGVVLASDGRQAALAIEGGTAVITFASYHIDPFPGWNVYASSYSVDGSLIADHMLLDSTGLNAAMPSVTGHAGEFLVTYEAGTPADVRGMRISLAGTLLDSIPFGVSTGVGAQWGPEVAGWGSGSFVTVWQDSPSPSQYNVVASRVNSAGTFIELGVTMGSQATERYGTAAADGARGTLLGWTEGSYYTTGQAAGIYGRVYSPGADLSSGATLRFGLLNPQDYSTRLMYPAAAASADGFMVVWTHNSESASTMKSVQGVLVFPRYGS